MNKIKVFVHHIVTNIKREMEHPNEEPIKEEIIGECGANYEPGDISSANSAIDNIIDAIIKEDEEFVRQAFRFGFEVAGSGTIELVVTREDDSIISSLTIDNSQELEMFQNVYKFLKCNFYYI